MYAASMSRRLPRALSQISKDLLNPSPLCPASEGMASGLPALGKWVLSRSFSFQPCHGEGNVLARSQLWPINFQKIEYNSIYSPILTANYSSEANTESTASSESAQELYEKMLKSVEARTMPPNALLWSMIGSCSNQEDIKLLFQILQKLRIFRLSNLRIHENFNCHLCMRVVEACVRAGAINYGLIALRKHNVYGLSPTIGSAHCLLMYAKEHNDVKLMKKIVNIMGQNSLPPQPGTVDIIFSICYNTNASETLFMYAQRFLKAGTKLHRSSYDIWMELATRTGDSDAIWKINSLRGRISKQYTIASGFACVKGFLLEHKPERAAAAIQYLYQHLPKKTKPQVQGELQKLIIEWPLEVAKRKNKEERQAFVESLKNDVTLMVTSILNKGLDLLVDSEKFPQKV
ncbi:adenylyl cyclase [Rhynchospora pubera]|uniref:Adenylyl cyclase n=1 Tax=Rhynchospora pubera TaxID=906938 RepID=A0AAV8HHD9_9POAL|nr:adenylyl cyclase [Rhynchospora pubera]KAJ4817295.1 adenylyl cyclase [Rhynchospora pubera]